jgi:hypothetical protein
LSLLTAWGVFREIQVGFLRVGHTHEDIDANGGSALGLDNVLRIYSDVFQPPGQKVNSRACCKSSSFLYLLVIVSSHFPPFNQPKLYLSCVSCTTIFKHKIVTWKQEGEFCLGAFQLSLNYRLIHIKVLTFEII